MKKVHLFLIIIFLLLKININAQFSVKPNQKELGSINNGQVVTFTIEVYNYVNYPDGRDYTVSFDSPYSTWLTANPIHFTLNYANQTQTIVFTGTYPMDWFAPAGQFSIDVYDEAGGFNYCLVTWNYVPPGGIEDYVRITEFDDVFSELDNLYYVANFYDKEPYGDYVTDWYLNMKLLSNEGEYIYKNIIHNCDYTCNWMYFQFQADQLPSNLTYARNADGNIFGMLEITGHDSDGYIHSDANQFIIKKKPDTPQLFPFPQNNNSVILEYFNTGAQNYKIYYDTDVGVPYNGTGLSQGNSPINAGTQTSYQIDGLQKCVPYYFSIVAENEEGVSEYSEEKKVFVFDIPNHLPINYLYNDFNVGINYNYSENYYFMGNLIVESGAIVTFEGGILYFSENSKIIIEPGGKLILNGATCTAPCGQTWQGIEVWGNTSAHQFTIDGVCAQGMLVLQNNASIENAWNAVTLWKPDNWNMTGGIVVASNSNFKNNKRSVEFISYHNPNPISGESMGNVSHFTNCDFIVDNAYVIPNGFETHISMFDVEGISINGCEFSNNISGEQNMGYGIYTLNAGYRITDYCIEPIEPCPQENLTRTTFSNFFAGISAGNAGSDNTLYLNNAEFHNNSYGVQLNALDNATIVFNDFYVGENSRFAAICNRSFGVGIDIINSNGYAIEENKFYSAAGMNGNDIGVRVNYNPDPDPKNFVPDVVYNEIYKNEFNGLKIANTAEGTNLSFGGPYVGLNYLCNHNANNGFDFYITGEGIRNHQGDNGKPAGNTFSLNGNNPYSDINNQAVWDILYHYERDDYNATPQYYNEKVYPISNSNLNTCPSHYGGGNQQQAYGMGLSEAQLQYFEQKFYDSRSNYTTTKALYKSLVDGGNTSAAITDIETAWPDEMWAMRAELLAKSPHLSSDVLMKTATRTDLFPDAIIFEIFSANPDALKDGRLIEFLQTKEDPMPQYMVDALKLGGETITYKTILQSELSEYAEKMSNAATIIIRNMLNDSLINNDTLRNWLERTETMAADYQLIDNYLQYGNPSAATALVNSLPEKYAFDDVNASEYQYYKTLKQLQAAIVSNQRNAFQLTTGEKSDLETIANRSSSRAGTQARNILAFVYGNEYVDCPRIPDPLTNKQGNASIYSLTENLLKVEAIPNPAKTWTAFNYSYPETTRKGTIQIRDTKGRLMQVLELEKAEGQIVWDTRNVVPGMYLFTLQADGFTKTGKLVVTK